MKCLYAFLLSVCLTCTLRAHSQELTLAAAADLRPALDEIAAKFKADSGITLRVSYGSSGNFYQQIQNGAPFDIFLSADVDYPKKLETAGLVVPSSYYEFARGSIVVIVPANSKVDMKAGLRALLDCDRREHFAGGIVCSFGRGRRRDCGKFAGARAFGTGEDEVFPYSRHRLSADSAGPGCSESVEE